MIGKPRNCTPSRVGPRRTCKWYPWALKNTNDLQRNDLASGDRVTVSRQGEGSCKVAAAIQYQGKTGTVIQLCSCGWAYAPQEGVWVRLDGVEKPKLLHWSMVEKVPLLDQIVQAVD